MRSRRGSSTVRKRQALIESVDEYASALAKYEDRLSASMLAEEDGWHRMNIKLENGTVTAIELQLTESVKRK